MFKPPNPFCLHVSRGVKFANSYSWVFLLAPPLLIMCFWINHPPMLLCSWSNWTLLAHIMEFLYPSTPNSNFCAFVKFDHPPCGFVLLEELNPLFFGGDELPCTPCVSRSNLTCPLMSFFVYYVFFEHMIPSLNSLVLVHELIVWNGYKYVAIHFCAYIQTFICYLTYLWTSMV